jgi:diguanylate cyclase
LRYTQSREQSAELVRIVLSLMGQHDAAFHPVSFAVWYEFASGINPRLKQAIETSLQTEPRLSDATLIRLYQAHVAETSVEVMQGISDELRRVLASMAEGAERTGDQAGTFDTQLQNLTLALNANDPSTVSQRVTETLAGTTQMRSSAQELQQQVIVSRREIERLQDDLSRARDEAVLDPLTGILNRKGFDAQLASLLSQPPSQGNAHCLIMLDIDHFKAVNDTHGHVMGDRVIQAMGEVLRTCVADTAHPVARYGGEEFAILLPHSNLDYGLALADTVRQRTRAMKIRDRRTQAAVLTVSVSGGVAAMAPGDDAQSLIARADGALYKSKQSGRDRVTCA